MVESQQDVPMVEVLKPTGRAHAKFHSLPNMHEDMPASSEDLQIGVQDLDALMSVYGTLRSFSFLFRLSPFTLKTFCFELNQLRISTLIDEVCVHVCVRVCVHVFVCKCECVHVHIHMCM